ncbi:MAG: hypothetical protein AMXMBFR7_22440 [Planctomycetota bacterium]
MKRHALGWVAVWFLLASVGFAAESSLGGVAKALGLPENASEAQVLQAIKSLQQGKASSAEQKVESRVDQALGHKYDKYQISEPTLGASEKKGQYYGRAEALFLFRYSLDEESAAPLAVNEDEDPFLALDTGDLDHDIAPGMRLMVGYQYNDAVSLELTYFGLHSFEQEGSVTDPDTNLSGTFGLDDDSESWGDELGLDTFSGAFAMRAEVRSDLHSGEFNVRHQVSKVGTFVPTVLAGVRYLNVNEEFELIAVANQGDTGGDLGRYQVDTNNHLFGLQLGLELTHTFNDWVSLSLSGKSGLMVNAASGDTTIRDGDDGVAFDADDDEVGLSFLTEVGAFATFRPHKNFDIRVGYNALVVTGLALGAGQYGAALERVSDDVGLSEMKLNRNGNLLFHGPSLGFTFRW